MVPVWYFSPYNSAVWPCDICQSGVVANQFTAKMPALGAQNVSWNPWQDSREQRLRCDRRHGLARPTEGCPCHSITLREHTLEVVDTFCYLGNPFGAWGGCKHRAIARSRSTYGKLRKPFPLLTNCYMHIKTCRKIFDVCNLPCCMVVNAGQWERRIKYVSKEMTRQY